MMLNSLHPREEKRIADRWSKEVDNGARAHAETTNTLYSIRMIREPVSPYGRHLSAEMNA